MTREMTYVETQLAQESAADIVNKIDDFLEDWRERVKPAIDAHLAERSWRGDEPGDQFDAMLEREPSITEVMDAVAAELDALRNHAILAGGTAFASEQADTSVGDGFAPADPD